MPAKLNRSARVDIVNDSGVLSVETIEGTGLRVAFDVEKSLDFEANRCTVWVWNLSRLSRDRASAVVRRKITFTQAERLVLEAAGASSADGLVIDTNLGIAHIRLSAGYGRDLGLIFDGSTEDIRHDHQGVDWRSEFACGDTAVRMREATLYRSYGPGTPVLETVTALIHSMGVMLLPPETAKLAAVLGPSVHAYGFTASGPALPLLQEMLSVLQLADYPFSWSVQDGQFLLLRTDQTLPLPPVELSPQTGLVGRPHRLEAGGVEVTALLDARYQAGQQVALTSRDVSGVFRVERVRHAGDTRGEGQFVSRLELRDFLEGIV